MVKVKRVYGVLAGVLVLMILAVLGTVWFYRAPILVNRLGEKLRQPIDRVAMTGFRLAHPPRVIFNQQGSLEERDWPYYFYAKVEQAGQPYYGELDYPAADEWFLAVKSFAGTIAFFRVQS